MLSVGQELTLRILKIDPETNKISLGLKQLEADPWTTAPERLQAGQRINGTVTRLTDFGAFVEIEPGLEGLIHISEMSWAKKLRHPSDMLKQGDRVDAVILSVKPPRVPNPAAASQAASLSASSRRSPIPGSKSSAKSPLAPRSKAPSPKS